MLHLSKSAISAGVRAVVTGFRIVTLWRSFQARRKIFSAPATGEERNLIHFTRHEKRRQRNAGSHSLYMLLGVVGGFSLLVVATQLIAPVRGEQTAAEDPSEQLKKLAVRLDSLEPYFRERLGQIEEEQRQQRERLGQLQQENQKLREEVTQCQSALKELEARGIHAAKSPVEQTESQATQAPPSATPVRSKPPKRSVTLPEVSHPVVKKWTQLLTSTEVSVRIGAVIQLGLSGQLESVAPLLVALGDPDPHVRLATCKALEKFQDARALLPLVEALSDTDESVRRSANATLRHLTGLSADFDSRAEKSQREEAIAHWREKIQPLLNK